MGFGELSDHLCDLLPLNQVVRALGSLQLEEMPALHKAEGLGAQLSVSISVDLVMPSQARIKSLRAQS